MRPIVSRAAGAALVAITAITVSASAAAAQSDSASRAKPPAVPLSTPRPSSDSAARGGIPRSATGAPSGATNRRGSDSTRAAANGALGAVKSNVIGTNGSTTGSNAINSSTNANGTNSNFGTNGYGTSATSAPVPNFSVSPSATRGAKPAAPPPVRRSNVGEVAEPMEFAAWTDGNIAAHLAIGDSSEIALGTLAGTRARDPRVRVFANRLVVDHAANLTQLRASVSRASFAAAVAPNDPTMQETARQMERLGQLQGAAFDSAFVALAVRMHDADAQTLPRLRARARTGTVRDLIDQTLPVIRRHLEEAQRLR